MFSAEFLYQVVKNVMSAVSFQEWRKERLLIAEEGFAGDFSVGV